MTSNSSTPLIKGETSCIARSLSRAILVVAALGAAALACETSERGTEHAQPGTKALKIFMVSQFTGAAYFAASASNESLTF